MINQTLCCGAERLKLETFCAECEGKATLETSENEVSMRLAEIALENHSDYIEYMADRFGGTF